ncbi:MAG: glycosyltransferase family 2 protein [Burkholderiales bacterium]|nr:glycosyltransferase family 2 protein [Burkholderiales bacterium]
MNVREIRESRTSRRSNLRCTLSVVVPLFNEEEVLEAFHARLVKSLTALGGTWEIVYVNDGSRDRTPRILQRLRDAEPAIGIVTLSRNFGKEAAMSAGLRLVKGDAAVVIDSDLQDPPELIGDMLAAWHAGADVVNMRRRSRAGETWIKKATARAFYVVINKLSDVPIPAQVGDFRLFSRRAIDALNQLPERNRFMKGLFAWIGYAQTTIDYDRQPRAAGGSKWPYRKLWGFALLGITSFSIVPLKLATYAGLSSAMGAFGYAFHFLVQTWFVGEQVRGFPTLIVTILLLGGLQLMATCPRRGLRKSDHSPARRSKAGHPAPRTRARVRSRRRLGGRSPH